LHQLQLEIQFTFLSNSASAQQLHGNPNSSFSWRTNSSARYNSPRSSAIPTYLLHVSSQRAARDTIRDSLQDTLRVSLQFELAHQPLHEILFPIRVLHHAGAPPPARDTAFPPISIRILHPAHQLLSEIHFTSPPTPIRVGYQFCAREIQFPSLCNSNSRYSSPVPAAMHVGAIHTRVGTLFLDTHRMYFFSPVPSETTNNRARGRVPPHLSHLRDFTCARSHARRPLDLIPCGSGRTSGELAWEQQCEVPVSYQYPMKVMLATDDLYMIVNPYRNISRSTCGWACILSKHEIRGEDVDLSTVVETSILSTSTRTYIVVSSHWLMERGTCLCLSSRETDFVSTSSPHILRSQRLCFPNICPEFDLAVIRDFVLVPSTRNFLPQIDSALSSRVRSRILAS